MKNGIILILENIAKQYNIEQRCLNDMDLLSIKEYSEITNTTEKKAVELRGDFDYVLSFSDHPDYAFFKSPATPEEITKEIFSWLKEINLIKDKGGAIKYVD